MALHMNRHNFVTESSSEAVDDNAAHQHDRNEWLRAFIDPTASHQPFSRTRRSSDGKKWGAKRGAWYLDAS